MMPETYVEIKHVWVTSGGPKVYCPYDAKTGTLYLGLNVLGSVPKNASVVGMFDEATGELILNSRETTKP